MPLDHWDEGAIYDIAISTGMAIFEEWGAKLPPKDRMGMYEDVRDKIIAALECYLEMRRRHHQRLIEAASRN
jgi:hypothetical protein